jgi:hypothetical protein
MVKVAPGFDRMPLATNGYSDLILELYGPKVGAHAAARGAPLGERDGRRRRRAAAHA